MSAIRLLDLILPPACAACGLPGGAACASCLASLVPLPAPWCEGCGAPVPVPVARCPACLGPVEGARQAVAYAGPATALVAALKDQRRRGLAGVLAEVVVARVPRPPEGATLVPVPLGPPALSRARLQPERAPRPRARPPLGAARVRAPGPGARGRRPARGAGERTGAAGRRGRSPCRPARWRPAGRGWWTTCTPPGRPWRRARGRCGRPGPRDRGRCAFARVPSGGPSL